MDQHEKKKQEILEEDLKCVTPEFIAKAAELSKEWSWNLTGAKLLGNAQRWARLSRVVPELMALRDEYYTRCGRGTNGGYKPSEKMWLS